MKVYAINKDESAVYDPESLKIWKVPTKLASEVMTDLEGGGGLRRTIGRTRK